MSDDDRLLETLGRAVREEDGLEDPRWDALSRGELEAEDEAELARRPPIREAEDAPFEVFRPLDRAERGALADGVFAALDAKKAKEGEGRAAEVVPIRRGWSSRMRTGAVIAAVIAAAAIVVIVARPRAPEAVAAYSMAIAGGDKTQMGAEPAREVRLGPGSRLELTLTPATPIAGALGVRAFLVGDGGVRGWDAPAFVGKGGVIRIEGSREALFEGVPEGAWDVVVIVGRPDAIPAEEELAALVRSGGDGVARGLRVLRAPVVLTPARGAAGDERGGRLRIDFGGCEAVTAGPGCELGERRTLRFWVDAREGAAIEVAIDGARQVVTPARVRGGLRTSLGVPEAAREVTVRVEDGGDQAALRLAIAVPATTPELREADALRRDGELDAASAATSRALEDPRPAVRFQALRRSARLSLARGRSDLAEESLRATIPSARALGRVSDELADRFALAHTLLVGRRFTEARALVEEASSIVDGDPEGRVSVAYYLGLIAVETGDLRGALRLFGEADEGAERLGFDELGSAVREQRADVLAALGRHAEAAALLRDARALLPASASACERARSANTLGWIGLRGGGGDARGPLDEALALARRSCPAELGHVLTNLALAELASGRPEGARKALEEARAAAPAGDPRDEVWWWIVGGRIALGAGRAEEALRAYERCGSIGARAALPEAIFEAALGRAEALDALGRGEPARAAFDDASRALHTWSREVPFGEGRGTFLAGHARATGLAVDFLLREAERAEAAGDLRRAGERVREASEAARRGPALLATALRRADRVSALAPAERAAWEEAVAEYRRERALLEEKVAEDWRRPRAGDAALPTREGERAKLRAALDRAIARLGPEDDDAPPRAPSEGELVLAYHPIREGWAGFAIEAGSITRRRVTIPSEVAAAPRDHLADALFAPFDEAIRRARRIRFAAPAPFAAADLHTLPWQGRPLIEHAPIAWGLDLPGSTMGAPLGQAELRPQTPSTAIDAQPPVALLVSDPTEDLPGARRSAGRVAASLEAQGFRVVRLDGAAATHGAVRDAIERSGARLFHYAGHAVFEGHDGWEAGFRLARRGRLTVTDLLALSRVPPYVVLTGCDTARAAAGDGAGGLGLAQAFVVKGARAVVAAARPLGDDVAERLSEHLYAELPASAPLDLAAALQRAQHALAKDTPVDAWSVLRALEP